MAKKQKMSAKQKQARMEAAAAREQAAAEAKARKETWKRIGIAVVAILLIIGLMLPMAGLTFCGNQQVQQATEQTVATSSVDEDGLVVEVSGDEAETSEAATDEAVTSEAAAEEAESSEADEESSAQ